MLQGDQDFAAADAHERAVTFGPAQGLLGILTEPVGQSGRSWRDQPAIVFINTGIIHRVGDNRLSTIWARSLARAGRTVMRFDLSGIGDSERRQDSLSLMDAMHADIRAALDWLASHRGAPRFILVGTCLGADRALAYAGTDPRVVGMVLIDPTTPATLRFYLRRYTRAMLNMESWRRLLAHRVLSPKFLYRHWRRLAGIKRAERHHSDPLSTPLRDAFADAYRAAVRANVRMLAIFTGGIAFRYNYREQLTDAFPDIGFDDLLQLLYLEKKDHLISLEADRQELFAITESWLRALPATDLPPATAGSGGCSSPPSAADLTPTEVEF